MPDGVVTAAIRECRDGVPGAKDRLWELVYPWFHRLAQILLARDGQRFQLTPEDLLHDAIMKVRLSYLEQPGVTRRMLCEWLLVSMREVLIDAGRRARVARNRLGKLRDGARADGEAESSLSSIDRLDLEDRLERLRGCDRAAFHVLEMFVFGHKTLVEVATLEGYSASKAGKLLQAAFERMRLMDDREDSGRCTVR